MNRTLMAGLFAASLVAACSKATPDNYERIEAGMTREEVHAVLGKPESVEGTSIGNLGTSSETWTSGDRVITAHFAGDTLVSKAIKDSGNPEASEDDDSDGMDTSAH